MENFKSLLKSTLWFMVPYLGIEILLFLPSFNPLDSLVRGLPSFLLLSLAFIAGQYVFRVLSARGFGRITAIGLSFEFSTILFFLPMQNPQFNDSFWSILSAMGFGAYFYIFVLLAVFIISFVTRALISTKGQPFFAQKWISEVFGWLGIGIFFVVILWFADRVV